MKETFEFLKIKTTLSYYNYVWNTNILQEYGVWADTSINAILTNRIYLGDTVQGKIKKINYKLKKIVNNNPNDYIIVENIGDIKPVDNSLKIKNKLKV